MACGVKNGFFDEAVRQSGETMCWQTHVVLAGLNSMPAGICCSWGVKILTNCFFLNKKIYKP